MTPPTFTLTVQRLHLGRAEHTAVTVTGDIDVANAADFVTAVGGIDGRRPLILDLNSLHYLDSAGFAALDRLLADGAVLIVLAPDSPVYAAATLMGLPCHETVTAAVAA